MHKKGERGSEFMEFIHHPHTYMLKSKAKVQREPIGQLFSFLLPEWVRRERNTIAPCVGNNQT